MKSLTRTRSLQSWLESGAEGPTFAFAAVCMIARASQMYSGGALVLSRALGPLGLQIFNACSGIGLAAGCELLMSISGRDWLAKLREATEAAGRPGLKKSERHALVAQFTAEANRSRLFCFVGGAASLGAALWYMWTVNPTHSLLGFGADVVVSALLVSVVLYLGVIKTARGADPAEIAQAQSYELRSRVVQEAGARLTSGQHSAQDVRIVSAALPRRERESFERAMLPDPEGDPLWNAREIAQWLRIADDAGRRKIARRLSGALDKGLGVRKDDAGAYVVPRSVAFRLFAQEFVELTQHLLPARDRAATASRPRAAREPVLKLTDPATAPTPTGPRQVPVLAADWRDA